MLVYLSILKHIGHIRLQHKGYYWRSRGTFYSNKWINSSRKHTSKNRTSKCMKQNPTELKEKRQIYNLFKSTNTDTITQYY